MFALKCVEFFPMEEPVLPPIPWPFGYVLAQDGVYAWAKRDGGLEALIPVVSAPTPLRGLYPAKPYVRLDSPPVDLWYVSEMLRLAQEAHDREILFYLNYEEASWQVTIPAQEQHAACVIPYAEAIDPLLYANTLIEIHSHQKMAAFFSGTDNRDERQAFRLFGVVGRVDGEPEIRMRVGIFGHFWEFPASWVLELPHALKDCVQQSHAHSEAETSCAEEEAWVL